jgi:hypothetical protein
VLLRERQPQSAPARRTASSVGTSASEISFVRARCSNAESLGGAERARHVVMGSDEHLD